MQFIKKNYEKVLLGLVLFGLVGAVGFLPFLIMSEKGAQEERRNQQFNFPVQPLAPVDTNKLDAVLAEAASPIHIDLSTTNRLFNPVRWLKAPNGPMKVPPGPGGVLGKLLEITKVNPLYLIISLDSVNVMESGTRYGIAVEQQGAASPSRRGKRVYYASVGDKKDTFTLREVRGDQPDSPTALILELPDTNEKISIAKGKEFKRVDAYTVDLKSEGRSYPNRRVGDRIVVQGEPYNIVAISENEVVMSAPNGKKYTIRYNAGS